MNPRERETARSGATSNSAGMRGAWFTALCCVVYFTSYLTRKGYDASILAICDDTGLARTTLGLASTAAVALYGSGQFITGFLADRFSPRKMVFLAMLMTAGCNATMPFAVGCLPAMIAIWATNGFAQAMFWPPIVKLVAAQLHGEAYAKSVLWISIASNIAIISVFFLVSGCIRIGGWRMTFAVVSGAALAVAAIWGLATRHLETEGGDPAPETTTATDAPAPATMGKAPLLRLMSGAGLFYVMGAIACQGVMRDGIEVWAPSIVRDQYGISTAASIFSVALLPVFAIASMVASRALRRLLGDEIETSIALFALGLCCATLLFAANGATLATGLPLLALLSATMHGANLMLIAELPARFAKYGCVGAISGILNAFTYVGAALSIYGFAAIHRRFSGWRPVFLLWITVLALAIALLLPALHRQRRAPSCDFR